MMNRKFQSLQTKIMIYGFLSALVSIVLFFTLRFCGNQYIENVYMSEDKIQKRMEKIIDQFNDFVVDGKISSNDYEKMEQWCQEKDTVYLLLYDEDGKLAFETDGTVGAVYQQENSPSTSEGSTTYQISFVDGQKAITMIDFSENDYYDRMKVVSFVVALIGLIVCVLVFSHRIIYKITFLSKEVREVRNGDLEKTISIRSNDEIGKLADDINEMRLSIIHHYEEAEEAWAANKELVTSISHDVRTPLTSLIGFSEMMEEEADVHLVKQYAKLCREKAYQIKDLTDQLFRYFLVYGNVELNLHFEEYDAIPFLEQLIGEHVALLSIGGYQVDFQNLKQPCKIRTDVTLLRRVCDNIFSNMGKYADKQETITIVASLEGETLVIVLDNVIEESTDVSASTHIGVKTCQKIMNDLGGQFESCERKEGQHRIYESKIIMTITEK